MKFQKFYIQEAVSEWMNMVLEELAIPQSYTEREFADNVVKVKKPEEFEGLHLKTFDHGKTGDHSMIMTFAMDDDGKIKYLSFGSEVNPMTVINPMTGEKQEDMDQNPLYQRSIALDKDGHISTKEIHPPFI